MKKSSTVSSHKSQSSKEDVGAPKKESHIEKKSRKIANWLFTWFDGRYKITRPCHWISTSVSAMTFHAKDGRTQTDVVIQIEQLPREDASHKETTRLTTTHKVLGRIGTSNEFPKLLAAQRIKLADEVFFAIVTEGIGPNLFQLYKTYRSFNMATQLMIAHQMVDRVMAVHKKGFLCRSLTMMKFGFGVQTKFSTLMITDYDHFCEMDTSGGVEIVRSKTTNYGVTDSAVYQSVNALEILGKYTVKDDLIALSTLLIHLYTATLPWIRLRRQHKVKTEWLKALTDIKKDFKVETIADQLTKSHVDFYNAAITMEPGQYDEFKVKYQNIFAKEMSSQGIPFDFKYDWIVRNPDD